MPGRRYPPGNIEASRSAEPVPYRGSLTWWQRRSWRMDLGVLARVRDGLKRLDAEQGGQGFPGVPPGDAADGPAAAPPVPAPFPGEEQYGQVPSVAAPVEDGVPDDVLPESALLSIRQTFAIAATAGDDLAGYFYGWLFSRNPRLREMFPPGMDAQRDRLLRALVRIVDSLSSPEDLVRYLSQLGHDHRKYSVEPAMYDAVGEALIATLRAFAGPAFTPEAQDAWTKAYQAASALMIRAAEEDSAVAPAFWTAEVIGHEQRRPGIAVLTVAPDEPLPYLAGQHVTVQTQRWPRVWRPFSVANRPRDDGLMTFHVRVVPGGWVSSALVYHTAPGDELTLGPALGNMTLAVAGHRDLLCVAGGTGLSPIKAIVEQAIRESSACPRQIFMFYGARTRDELYDLPDMYRLADAYPRFLFTPVTSDDPVFEGMQGNVGRVAARYLPHRECEAYVAGPIAMVRETIRVLKRAGIPPERIHYDDALLAEEDRAGQRRARGDAGNGDNAKADAQPARTQTVPQDDSAPDGAERQDEPSGAEDEGVAREDRPGAGEQVPASVVAERYSAPPA